MSNYEWERGTIRLPAKIYFRFKKELWERAKEVQAHQFDLAMEFFTELKRLGKGKRNFDYEEAYSQLVKKKKQIPWGYVVRPAYIDDSTRSKILKCSEGRRRCKPQKPRKKDFAVGTLKNFHFAGGEFSIRFDDGHRIVRWNVFENNHACEVARDHPVAQKLFDMLSRVEWTRGSGGKIDGVGEGGNYVTHEYGPWIH